MRDDIRVRAYSDLLSSWADAKERIQAKDWEIDRLTATIKSNDAEVDRAMAVLSPSIPESGLEDACRQVKQAAMTWEGVCSDLEARIDQLTEALEQIVVCESRYYRDPLERAHAAVEHCQATARAALAQDTPADRHVAGSTPGGTTT